MTQDPRRLSTTINSVQERRERILFPDGVHPGARDRLLGWVLDNQTFRAGLRVFLATAFVPLIAICFLPALFPRLTLKDRNLQFAFADRIGTIADVSAGISGILLAVIVFSVQLHSQREDEGAFMTRYLAKKHCVPWITGYGLGFAAFNCSLLLLHVLGIPCWWKATALYDLVGLTLLLVATLWLVMRSVRDATEVTFAIGFDLFRKDLAHLIATQSYLNDLREAFQKLLHGSVLVWSPRALQEYQQTDGMTGSGRQTMAFVHCDANSGVVTDINPICLKSLADAIEGISRRTDRFKAEIGLIPGDSVDEFPALRLSATDVEGEEVRNTARAQTSTAQFYSESYVLRQLSAELTEEVVRDIQDLVDRTFIIESVEAPTAKECDDFFERFGHRLKALAEKGDSTGLRQLLARYGEVLQTTANAHEQAVSASGSIRMHSAYTNPLSTDLFDVARICVDSSVQNSLEVIIDATTEFYHIGSRCRSIEICRWALQLSAFIYGRALGQER